MTSLMAVGNLKINREDLTFDTVRKIAPDSPAIRRWLMVQRANDLTKKEALIGMVIALDAKLKEAEKRLTEVGKKEAVQP